MNNRGSILTVTLGFVLIFSLLGVALLRHATVQNETTERRTHSVEAFWIADAAVERARHKLPGLINVGDTLGQGSYNVYSELDDCHCYEQETQIKACYNRTVPDCTSLGYVQPTGRWHIRSQGLVNKFDVDDSQVNQFRGIDALVAAYDISNAITSHGSVNQGNHCNDVSVDPECHCQPWSAATQIVGGCEPYVDFTFETVFNGMSYSDFLVLAAANLLDPSHTYYDDTAVPWPFVNHLYHVDLSSDNFNIDGTTVIIMEDGLNTLNIDTSDDDTYPPTNPSSLLIVKTNYDGSGPIPKVDFAGFSSDFFCGVVWIIGKTQITGNGTINGAVFVDEYPASDTTVTGTPKVNYDPTCVDGALSGIPGLGTPGVIAWKEYAL